MAQPSKDAESPGTRFRLKKASRPSWTSPEVRDFRTDILAPFSRREIPCEVGTGVVEQIPRPQQMTCYGNDGLLHPLGGCVSDCHIDRGGYQCSVNSLEI
jgi:hypothetical protein